MEKPKSNHVIILTPNERARIENIVKEESQKRKPASIEETLITGLGGGLVRRMTASYVDNNSPGLSLSSCLLNSDSDKREAVINYLKPHLRGNPIVDLGCGREDSVKNVSSLVKAAGVQEYEGIDINMDAREAAFYSNEFSDKDFYCGLMPNDMLNLISQVKDVNVTINGIVSDIKTP